MKKFKLLSSIAAIVAISCTTAVAAMANSIELELDAAKTTANSKVINVYYKGDSLHTINAFTQILFNVEGANLNDVTASFECGGSPTYAVANGQFKISHTGNPKAEIAVENGSALIATLTVPASDSLTVAVDKGVITGYKTGTVGTNQALKPTDLTVDSLAVVKADDLGTFTTGEGAPAKAYKAAASVAGDITWFVTDGTKVAEKAVTEVSGGAGVVVGLVATGANAGNINYAAVAID